MKARKQDIAPLLAATFPDYRGRRFFVEAASSITLYDLNWCEGVRNAYRAVTLDGVGLGADKLANMNATAPWKNYAEGSVCSVPVGLVVACHSYRGMHESVTFYINPADMPKVIKQGVA